VVGVLGGSGGAGATTFACALGQVAARRGPSVVVDLDPLGPGVDRILGLESAAGVRWDALGRAGGRLGSQSLREALPRAAGLGVLTWSGRGEPPEAGAVREALSALRRGHDTVVVDLPRSVDALVEEVLARCDRVLVVVTPTVAGTASAARLLARLPDPAQVRLVLRGPGVDEREVAAVTGVPVLTRMRDQRGLAEAIDLGLGPARSPRVPLARAAALALQGSLRQVAA
jgi:secretion/DNA translocation related CpaE-like protein